MTLVLDVNDLFDLGFVVLVLLQEILEDKTLVVETLRKVVVVQVMPSPHQVSFGFLFLFETFAHALAEDHQHFYLWLSHALVEDELGVSKGLVQHFESLDDPRLSQLVELASVYLISFAVFFTHAFQLGYFFVQQFFQFREVFDFVFNRVHRVLGFKEGLFVVVFLLCDEAFRSILEASVVVIKGINEDRIFVSATANWLGDLLVQFVVGVAYSSEG